MDLSADDSDGDGNDIKKILHKYPLMSQVFKSCDAKCR